MNNNDEINASVAEEHILAISDTSLTVPSSTINVFLGEEARVVARNQRPVCTQFWIE
jgi:hypothetical protein